MIFSQLFFALVASAKTDVAPVFSMFVVLYTLTSLYCYFGIFDISIISATQSYCASLKLALIAVGYSAESLISGNRVSFAFLAMTALLSFDAFYGMVCYFHDEKACQEKKSFNSRSTLKAIACMDSWKSGLAKSANAGLRATAVAFMSTELMLALAVLLTHFDIVSLLSILICPYSWLSSL